MQERASQARKAEQAGRPIEEEADRETHTVRSWRAFLATVISSVYLLL